MGKVKKENGRPTKYLPVYAEQARKLCLLGYKDTQLAEFFEVSEATIYNWKNSHPDFLEALQKGKTIADAEVAEGLYKRACGFSRKVTKTMKTQEGPVEYEEEYYFPPETKAAERWLFNRQPKLWRDKQDNENGTEKQKTQVFIIGGKEFEF